MSQPLMYDAINAYKLAHKILLFGAHQQVTTLIISRSPLTSTYWFKNKKLCSYRGDCAGRWSLRRSRSFKVTNCSTDRKQVGDFLLANNINPLSYRFYRAAWNATRS